MGQDRKGIENERERERERIESESFGIGVSLFVSGSHFCVFCLISILLIATTRIYCHRTISHKASLLRIPHMFTRPHSLRRCRTIYITHTIDPGIHHRHLTQSGTFSRDTDILRHVTYVSVPWTISYYPLFPPEAGVNFDMSHVDNVAMPTTPDVLLLPSKLRFFAKVSVLRKDSESPPVDTLSLYLCG